MSGTVTFRALLGRDFASALQTGRRQRHQGSTPKRQSRRPNVGPFGGATTFTLGSELQSHSSPGCTRNRRGKSEGEAKELLGPRRIVLPGPKNLGVGTLFPRTGQRGRVLKLSQVASVAGQTLYSCGSESRVGAPRQMVRGRGGGRGQPVVTLGQGRGPEEETPGSRVCPETEPASGKSVAAEQRD